MLVDVLIILFLMFLGYMYLLEYHTEKDEKNKINKS